MQSHVRSRLHDLALDYPNDVFPRSEKRSKVVCLVSGVCLEGDSCYGPRADATKVRARNCPIELKSVAPRRRDIPARERWVRR
jgi:hypothetical protein